MKFTLTKVSFYLLNGCLGLLGVGVTSEGIAVCAESQDMTWYDASFILIGLLFVGLAGYGHWVRSNSNLLVVYLATLLILVIFLVCFTIGIMSYQGLDSLIGQEPTKFCQGMLITGCLTAGTCLVAGFLHRRRVACRPHFLLDE